MYGLSNNNSEKCLIELALVSARSFSVPQSCGDDRRHRHTIVVMQWSLHHASTRLFTRQEVFIKLTIEPWFLFIQSQLICSSNAFSCGSNKGRWFRQHSSGSTMEIQKGRPSKASSIFHPVGLLHNNKPSPDASSSMGQQAARKRQWYYLWWAVVWRTENGVWRKGRASSCKRLQYVRGENSRGKKLFWSETRRRLWNVWFGAKMGKKLQIKYLLRDQEGDVHETCSILIIQA